MTGPSLLALHAGEDDPSARHRVLDLLDSLREAGLQVRSEPVPTSIGSRWGLLGRVREFSAVLLQRRLTGPPFARLLRRAAKRLVFDFDDALPFTDSWRGARPSRTRERRFTFMVSQADLVVAGNAYLARLARERGAREVLVLPTGLREEAYPPAPGRRAGGVLRAGWIGSSSTLPYLEALDPILERVMVEEPRLRLSVLCDRRPRMSGIPVDFTPWSAAEEVPFLHSLDVGLAPLPDDAWTRGKCGLRILKYHACAVPVVATATGVQPELLEWGGAGRLVEEGEDWLPAILAVGREAERTRSMVSRGRTLVRQRYSTTHLGRELARAVSALCVGVR